MTPDAVHVVRADRHGVRVAGVEDRLDGVDRAGPNVAEHDTECTDHHEPTEPFPRRRRCEAVTPVRNLCSQARSSFK